MSRLVQKPVSLFGLALIFVAAPLWWFFRPPPVAAQGQGPGQPVPGATPGVAKQVALMHAGLDAKSLAAAGVSASAVNAFAQAANSQLAANPTAISNAEHDLAIARRESDRLLRLIQAGKATEQHVTDYQTQKAAFDGATAHRQAALDALFQAATANMSPQQRATLAAVRGNNAQSEIPVEFRTVNRSKADWLQLRDDLANERISAQQGEEPYAPGQTRLATARANATVAAAKAALDTNLTAVTTALHSALSEN